MKTFVKTLLILVFLVNCKAQNKEAVFEADSKLNTKPLQDIEQIEYKTFARSGSEFITINENTLEFKNNSGIEEVPCSKQNWLELKTLINTLDLPKISELEAPTKKRLFDGAAAATLHITTQGKTFSSVTFDHGNPPKELLELVTKILTLAESAKNP